MQEEKDDVLVLTDENGDEEEFEYIDTIEMNGNEYVVLLPLIDSEKEQEIEEVVILKIEHGVNGEDSFISIDSDDELDMVFEEFKTRMEDEYDFTE